MLIKYSKDKALRKLVNQTELKAKIIKFVRIRVLNYPCFKSIKKKFLLLKVQTLLKSLNRTNSKVKIQRRCILTNRNRGVLQAYSISRLKFLELCRFGIIPGYRKAVW